MKRISRKRRGDVVDRILYWIVHMWIEETHVPQSVDIACVNAIKYNEQKEYGGVRKE